MTLRAFLTKLLNVRLILLVRRQFAVEQTDDFVWQIGSRIAVAEIDIWVIQRHQFSAAFPDRGTQHVVHPPAMKLDGIACFFQNSLDFICLDLAIAIAKTKFVECFFPLPLVGASANAAFTYRHDVFLLSRIQKKGGSLRAALVFVLNRQKEQNAVAVHQIGRDNIQTDDRALLVAFASPGSTDLLRTGQNILAVVILPSDA